MVETESLREPRGSLVMPNSWETTSLETLMSGGRGVSPGTFASGRGAPFTIWLREASVAMSKVEREGHECIIAYTISEDLK